MNSNNYLLAGNSSFLKEEALEKIKAKLFSEGLERNQIERFDAEEDSIAKVLESAQTFPLFSSQSLVILRNVDRFDKHQLEQLSAYLKQPQKTTVLVSLTQDEKITPSWLDLFKGICQLQVLNLPYENQLEGWIIQRISPYGRKIDIQAARLLRELIGTDLRVLATEIQKLILYAGDRAVITLGDVEHLVAQAIHYSGFVLGDAIGTKDISMALSVLSRLLDEQKSIPEIIGLISWQMQRMLQAKQKFQKGESWDQIARALRISSPFFIRKFQQQLTRWEFPELREAVTSLLETDVAIKSGQYPAQLALEDWLVTTLTRQVSSSIGISYGQRRWNG